jgi:hypothetical protein
LFRWRWPILAGYLVLIVLLWCYAGWYRLGSRDASGTLLSFGLLAFILALQLYIPLSVVACRRFSSSLGNSPRLFLVLGSILTSAIPLLAVIVWNLSLPTSDRMGLEGFSSFVLFVGAFFGTQALFLTGAPAMSGPNIRNGKPIWLSVAAGTLVVAFLCVGLMFALDGILKETGGQRLSRNEALVRGLALLMVAWAFWFGIIGLLWRRFGWSSAFRGMYRFLLGGTCLELLITIPVDVQVRRRTNCYCGEATFFALFIGLFLVLWLFGPGVLLLFLLRREQRRRRPGFCRECGLNLRGWTGPNCPDCNAFIPRRLGGGDSSETGGESRCYDE